MTDKQLVKISQKDVKKQKNNPGFLKPPQPNVYPSKYAKVYLSTACTEALLDDAHHSPAGCTKASLVL